VLEKNIMGIYVIYGRTKKKGRTDERKEIK
jgi:hypothetical protein